MMCLCLEKKRGAGGVSILVLIQIDMIVIITIICLEYLGVYKAFSSDFEREKEYSKILVW